MEIGGPPESIVRSYHHEVSAAIGRVAAEVRLVKSDQVSQGHSTKYSNSTCRTVNS